MIFMIRCLGKSLSALHFNNQLIKRRISMSIRSDQVCAKLINNNRKIRALEKQKKGITADIKNLQIDSDEAINEFEENSVE